MNCTLCDSQLKKMADEYYFICETCGAYVMDKKYYLGSSEEKNRYKEHNNDVNDTGYQNFTSPITDSILKNHTKEQLGLDYGCGTGPVISKQLEAKGYKVKLYDPYFYPNQGNLNHQFDYIFSCEVFEHFYNPKQEIEKLLSLLKPEGNLFIMTHLYNTEIDFKNWYYRKDPTHVFIYTKETIAFIGKKFDLRIEILTDRLIIAKSRVGKGESHPQASLRTVREPLDSYGSS
ncbi:class I SAM-dependent methyltransferase [Perlabentimonas gracilis]|uniref:class I SAM-dependent methyltransferase n=1 Tax=Perlabentimonas gracilis TaxID=2715279 RepID=UPI001407E1F8|nr:class I SAM-dependent methyltransferase [Perlabentimonas gracilis]NHB70407.1 class I SAM-dependent methyltransferase [Perlabentimonas gracilis]